MRLGVRLGGAERQVLKLAYLFSWPASSQPVPAGVEDSGKAISGRRKVRSGRSCDQLKIRSKGRREDALCVLQLSSGWDWRTELEKAEGEVRMCS